MTFCEVWNAARPTWQRSGAQLLRSGLLPSYLAVFGTSKYEIVRGLKCCQVNLAAFGTSNVEVRNAARSTSQCSGPPWCSSGPHWQHSRPRILEKHEIPNTARPTWHHSRPRIFYAFEVPNAATEVRNSTREVRNSATEVHNAAREVLNAARSIWQHSGHRHLRSGILPG